jgi:hypothetical protein
MRVKLLDRDDIRRFGGTIVDIPDHIANGLIERWRATKVEDAKPTDAKAILAPPMNKAVWSPPEEKSMLIAKQALLQQRKPAASEPIFPKTVIS